MRYDAEHKQRTRQNVLKVAAQSIRNEGPHRIGVAAVMAEAGLTHGGFYAHFASKDDLVAAAIDEMLRQGGKRFDRETEGYAPATALARYIDFYLSREHRDSRGLGCPLPYLSADAPRLTDRSREAFAVGVGRLAARLANLLEALGRRDSQSEASSLLAELVGALSLARADPDPQRSDAILARSRAALKLRYELEARS
jgi:TetR/AcrR family transcriptional regulator, transcriptional repressor for nem operon